jgi:hypothetical protein
MQGLEWGASRSEWGSGIDPMGGRLAARGWLMPVLGVRLDGGDDPASEAVGNSPDDPHPSRLDASFVPDVRLGFCLSREMAVSTGRWAECSVHGDP